MDDAGKSELLSTGAVLFFDVDEYLKAAGDWNTAQEMAHSNEVADGVTQACKASNFQVARNIGDGYLLFSQSEISTDLAKNTLKLIRSLAELFANNNMTIRGAFASGLFGVSKRGYSEDTHEVVLVGPLVNFTGKLHSTVPKGEFFGAWQSVESASVDASFSGLRAQQDRFSYWRFKSHEAPISEPNSEEEPLLGNNEIEDVSSDLEAQMYFSEQIKMFILETTKIADDKAKAAFGVAAGLLVFLFNFSGSGFFVSNSDIEWSLGWSFMIELGSLLFFSLTCVFAFLTFVPRQTTRFPRGLAFYGSIAAWDSATNYLEAINGRNREALADELTTHNFEISKVSTLKFYWLKFALWSLGAGVALMFLRFFLLRISI